MSKLTTLTFKKIVFLALHTSKFPSSQKMSQIPLFSSKRCNAPPFLLSILYKTSFPFHVFCFITHIIIIYFVVQNTFHTSSKLNAAIYWFSKPFHYIFLLFFRQKAARSVRKGVPQAISGDAAFRERVPQAKRGGARRAKRSSAGNKR